VAPFLAKRIWNGKAPAVELVECKKCSFLFFNPRLEPDEEQRLYAGYRQGGYQKDRFSCEPWYTEKFNATLADPNSLGERREKLGAVLATHLAGIDRPKILDFGGDRGDLIQNLIPHAAAYIYEISGVEPAEGITCCADLADCRAQSFDAIVCSNVLEHIGFPQTILDQLKTISAPHTKVFIEVPFESPFGPRLVLRRLAQFGVLAVTRPAVAWGLAKPGMLLIMHEHINYFNQQSLEAMLGTWGAADTVSGSYELGGNMGKGFTMGWCAGRLGR